MRKWLITALAVMLSAACGEGKSSDESENKESKKPVEKAKQPEAPAPDKKPNKVAVNQPEFDIDRVDSQRFVVRADVFTQVAVELAGGKLQAEALRKGYRIRGAGSSEVMKKLGLLDGDVIVQVNDLELTRDNLESIHATVRAEGYAAVSVLRNGVAVKRRYVTRSSLENDDNIGYLRSLSKGPKVKAKTEYERLIKELRTGVKNDGDQIHVDKNVLEVIGNHEDLTRYGRSLSSYRSKVRGIHVADKDSVYGVLGLTEYDVVKSVGSADTHYHRSFREELGRMAGASQFTMSVVRLGEPTVLHYQVVTGLIKDSAALESLAAEWERKAKEDDPYRSLTGSYSSGLSQRSGSGTRHTGYVSWYKIRPLVQALEKATKSRGTDKLEVKKRALRAVLAEPGAVVKGARLVKAYTGSGYRVYGLISGSPLKVLGLESGDTIHEINDKKLDHPDDLESMIASAVRSSRTVRIAFTRTYRRKLLVWKLR